MGASLAQQLCNVQLQNAKGKRASPAQELLQTKPLAARLLELWQTSAPLLLQVLADARALADIIKPLDESLLQHLRAELFPVLAGEQFLLDAGHLTR